MSASQDELPLGFRARVWAEVRLIPPGRVLGYGHVAARIGRPRLARQVGWAMAALPADTEVPWWRVIRSSGHLALQGDPTRGVLQRGLLEAEGVVFDEDRVDMGLFCWDGE